jgi:FkbM family methyltransferase
MEALKRTFNFINTHPLARHNKLLALWKFVTWQIKCRINRGLILIPFIEGTKVYAQKGLTGITGNIYTGLHEFNDMAFLLHFLRDTDVFFDVGANVGSYTILASGVCGSKTLAFEPIKSTFNILSKNVVINNLSKLVGVENIGIGKEEGLLVFTTKEDTGNHILAKNENSEEVIEVRMKNIDSYLSYQPSLIKIDVEGFETEVLNGANEILKTDQLKAIIIELNGSSERYGYSDDEIHKKLLAHSFKPYSYNAFQRQVNELPGYGQFNTIYLRDTDLVISRLKAAKKFNVFNTSI